MKSDPRLLNVIMRDGSRHFANLPQRHVWLEVHDHVARLPQAKLTGFICDGVTECWVDFDYLGHHFSINDQQGDYWFFVEDPRCPDEILLDVVDHFSELLGSRDAYR